MTVALSFQGGGDYHVQIIRDDGAGATAARTEEANRKRGDSLALDLAAGSGSVAAFRRR